jgi:hypothetical protein
MSYIIKNCNIQELPSLQDFIHKHWKENHALYKSKALMDFQHFNQNQKEYNFIIAINSETKEIDGMLGYISTNHYDAALNDNGDFWGVIWKVRTDVKNEDINPNYSLENY